MFHPLIVYKYLVILSFQVKNTSALTIRNRLADAVMERT
jgi:hypothetical protein